MATFRRRPSTPSAGPCLKNHFCAEKPSRAYSRAAAAAGSGATEKPSMLA